MPLLGESLTVDQQVGQLVAIGFAGTTPDDHVLELIRHRHVGNVILFARNIQSAAQVLELTTSLQRAARDAGHPAPLLVMTDQEGGLVRRLGPDATVFPGSMALGAAGSEDLAREVAEATGRELAAQGITMNLAPVVDINSNPANPVIGVRAYGEDVGDVARLGAAAVRGYTAGGVIATLKHFPGHGDTAIDSHSALPVIAAARERLDRIELVPFARGISAGAACVLTAHVALPEVEPAGAILPASLSPTVVQGLLRGGLGFDGVAITDCLEMDAVAAGVGMARGAVQAIRAGNDIALVSHRADRQGAALDAILAAVAQREITSERLGEAVDRVLRLKRRHLWWDRLPAPGGLGVVGGPTHRALAARAYAASTTIIRDDHAQIPLRLAPGERLLVVVVPPRAVTAASDSVLDEDGLLAGVGRLHPDSTLTRAAPGDGDGGGLADMAASADLVVLITINCHADERHRATAARIADAARRVVGLAASDPYDAGVLPSIGTFLASYDYATPALVAAFDVIFGRRAATGRLPVTI